jgi:hypothetical protein
MEWHPDERRLGQIPPAVGVLARDPHLRAAVRANLEALGENRAVFEVIAIIGGSSIGPPRPAAPSRLPPADTPGRGAPRKGVL